jgi:hypothetical protein
MLHRPLTAPDVSIWERIGEGRGGGEPEEGEEAGVMTGYLTMNGSMLEPMEHGERTSHPSRVRLRRVGAWGGGMAPSSVSAGSAKVTCREGQVMVVMARSPAFGVVAGEGDRACGGGRRKEVAYSQ